MYPGTLLGWVAGTVLMSRGKEGTGRIETVGLAAAA